MNGALCIRRNLTPRILQPYLITDIDYCFWQFIIKALMAVSYLRVVLRLMYSFFKLRRLNFILIWHIQNIDQFFIKKCLEYALKSNVPFKTFSLKCQCLSQSRELMNHSLQIPDSQTNIFRQKALANCKHRKRLHFLKRGWRNYPIISIIWCCLHIFNLLHQWFFDLRCFFVLHLPRSQQCFSRCTSKGTLKTCWGESY